MSKSLRILVVENSPEKYKRVTTVLAAKLAQIDCQFTLADNYNRAFKLLQSSLFDLVLLDLLIPLASGSVSTENSRALIEMMMAGDLIPAPHIIGLTEYHEAAREERRYFAANMFSLEMFSWTSTAWADRLAGKINYLFKSKAASINYSLNNFESDLLIMVARYENEFKPIAKHMIWEAPPVQHNHYFPTHHCVSGRLMIDPEISLKTTCLCIGEMGGTVAAAVTSEAINLFRPQLVIMLGMCCGFTDPRSSSPALFGDVIFARESASWDEGKYVELEKSGSHLFRNRAVVRTADDRIGSAVSSCVEASQDLLLPSCEKYWNSRNVKNLRSKFSDEMRLSPDFKIGMIVSGSSVIADPEKIDEIITRHPTALGLDMEVFGVFTAVQNSIGNRPSVFAIKGVADFGTGKKHDYIQGIASTLSFYSLVAILRLAFRNGQFAAI